MDDAVCKGPAWSLRLTQSEAVMILMGVQALEGKNVKDMLLNVGSGGGAAAAPSGGAAAGAAATDAPAEKEEEKKEEGELDPWDMLFRVKIC